MYLFSSGERIFQVSWQLWNICETVSDSSDWGYAISADSISWFCRAIKYWWGIIDSIGLIFEEREGNADFDPMASLFLVPLYLALTIEMIREEEANFSSVITILSEESWWCYKCQLFISYCGQYMGVSLDHKKLVADSVLLCVVRNFPLTTSYFAWFSIINDKVCTKI